MVFCRYVDPAPVVTPQTGSLQTGSAARNRTGETINVFSLASQSQV